jgi:hypothetical protein
MRLVRSGNYAGRAAVRDRRDLVNAVTLIALGLSLIFLNSWDTLFVRSSIGLFWGTFFLILNWSGLISAIRLLKQKNDIQRRTSQRTST